jgi:D-lactate dehydrogenase
MLTGTYQTLYQRLSSIIPEGRLIHDDLRLLAYGTDASFYRLLPKLVVRVENETEVTDLLRECRALRTAVTFRAAGTSLSGQAVSDSVLAVLGPSWQNYEIRDGGALFDSQPGVVGATANAALARFGRKIGPDPASINSAMIGGIAANNASGMCCGTAQNSYRTLDSVRMIFGDGTVLDTGNPASRAAFAVARPEFLRGIADLGERVRGNTALADRIRRKFSMKNTTGYSLNALTDFEDPFEILQHLMIGSEGTLGFLSRIRYRTVPELPHKASSLMLFPDIRTACEAVSLLKQAPVDAVELMDRPSLRSVEEKKGMPPVLAALDPEVAAILVETRASSSGELDDQIRLIGSRLDGLSTVSPIAFTAIPDEFAALWNIRKGLFPSVGAVRRTGTTVIIEDVAFPVPRLAEATLDLQRLFRVHGYDEAIIFGHALEGNLHFVFTQDFGRQQEVDRYRRFIDDVTSMVIRTYDGSLKAEHGTGRNMAPFVELEWGAEATGLMREIKALFDPLGLLNPGVILNDDPLAHLQNLKPLPPADPLVDKCIECGFCEVQCPSRNLSLTPRQRITVFREIMELRRSGKNRARLERLEQDFAYQGNATCATDGLCATSCPVSIDTGKLIKELRLREVRPAAASVATVLADHMAAVTAGMRFGLDLVHGIHSLLGTRLMRFLAGAAHRWAGLPLWNPHMPRGADRIVQPPAAGRPRVVYFPTCINRGMGADGGSEDTRSVSTLILSLLDRAGYDVVLPPNRDDLCCGMAFASKGFKKQGDRKARELEDALLMASEQGTLPVLVDMSPCLYRMKETFTSDIRLYDPVRFALEFLVDRLTIRKLPETVAVHTTCSSEKMGLAGPLRRLASMCADTVVVPEGIGCCGWAGDRGFTVPELNASALDGLQGKLPANCGAGYSTSRTCEIGLSLHAGIPYSSVLYLLDRASAAGKA